MNDPRIVCVLPDGTVDYLTPNPATRREGESQENWIARVAAKDAPEDTVTTLIVEADDLPSKVSKRFRRHWRVVGGRVVTDLAEARKQLLGELRAERNARLTASDGEKSRLDDVGTREQRQALATYRQSLRDLPAAAKDALDGIATAEGLLAWQPTWPTIAPTPSEVQK